MVTAPDRPRYSSARIVWETLWGCLWRFTAWGLAAGAALGMLYSGVFLLPLTEILLWLTGRSEDRFWDVLLDVLLILAATPLIAGYGIFFGALFGSPAGAILGMANGVAAGLVTLATGSRPRQHVWSLRAISVAMAVMIGGWFFSDNGAESNWSGSRAIDVVLLAVLPTLIAALASLWIAGRVVRWYQRFSRSVVTGTLPDPLLARLLHRYSLRRWVSVTAATLLILTATVVGVHAYMHRDILVEVPAGPAVISQDARQVAISTTPGFHVWSLDDGHPLHAIPLDIDGSWIWNAERDLVAFREGSRVRVVRASDGADVTVLPERASVAIDMEWSPDGSLLSVSTYRDLQMWIIPDARLLYAISPGPYANTAPTFSPDGSTFVTRDERGLIRLWRTSDGQLLRVLSQGQRYPRTTMRNPMLFSPDGRLLAIYDSDADTIITRRVSDARTIMTVPTDDAPGVSAIAFSPDGTLLAASNNRGAIRIWRVDNAELVRVHQGDVGSAQAIAFSADGRHIISVGSDGVVRMRSSQNGR